jgi:hypothetical protein
MLDTGPVHYTVWLAGIAGTAETVHVEVHLQSQRRDALKDGCAETETRMDFVPICRNGQAGFEPSAYVSNTLAPALQLRKQVLEVNFNRLGERKCALEYPPTMRLLSLSRFGDRLAFDPGLRRLNAHRPRDDPGVIAKAEDRKVDVMLRSFLHAV